MIYDNVLNIITTTPISQIPNSQLNVRYFELNEEQIARYESKPNDIDFVMNNIDKTQTLEYKKSEKLSTLQSNYDTQLSLGYTYNNWVFNLDENTKENIGDWTSFLVLEPNLNEFRITDSSSVQRVMTKEQFTIFGVGFGVKLSTLKSNFANKRNLINLSENETQLNEINLEL